MTLDNLERSKCICNLYSKKVLPYSILSVGHGADSSVPQVTFKSSSGGWLPLLSARPASLPRKLLPDGEHLIAAYYSFIDPERMKGFVDLAG